ncbi:MAG: hypothetical protein HYV63_25725 [Candidatus Schekmanbacteria bacterium]|nr:hypothetical protein [Candidatus Schekmanbacteria bacterium]
MSSMLHQALLALFENCHELAVELLRGVADVHLPAFDRVRGDPRPVGKPARWSCAPTR